MSLDSLHGSGIFSVTFDFSLYALIFEHDTRLAAEHISVTANMFLTMSSW
jgi:hypothetical protein